MKHGTGELTLGSEPPPPARGGDLQPATARDRWLADKLLQFMGRPPVGLTLWDGREIGRPAPGSSLRVILRDRAALLRLLLNPDLEFGELYGAGRLEIEGDLSTFLLAVARARLSAGRPPFWARMLTATFRSRRNTLSGSRDNIHHHYDLGNEFYVKWLDRELLYTCAYYPTPEASLEEAQLAKMDHVARKLRLRPGERVVEAGCGWGALALHMARHYGVSVDAYNISREQLAWARRRAEEEGLTDRVRFHEGDYREIRGQFEAFVSVGMLEHVGKAYYRDLGAVMDRCLGATGRGLIHSIGQIYPVPLNAWIRQRIFPGAYPPTLGELMPLFDAGRFSVLDVENLRLHYARTLEHWLARFEQATASLRESFSEAFLRHWRLYLAASVAGFAVGDNQLFQIVFARASDNAIPWTRQHLYSGTGEVRHGEL